PPAAFSHRSEAQRTEAYASPLRSLRPCWTAFLIILKLFWRQHCTENFSHILASTEFFRSLLGRLIHDGLSRNR
ncbi:MAG: hypothetical protein SGJ26_20650, partial [Nitrospirota bacterium]|nr:hypothetical protein [Nitrospirota bacterium]